MTDVLYFGENEARTVKAKEQLSTITGIRQKYDYDAVDRFQLIVDFPDSEKASYFAALKANQLEGNSFLIGMQTA